MATCHQAHNIPWQNLVDCYGIDKLLQSKSMGPKSPCYAEFIEPYRKKLAHFVKCFQSTIGQFVETERKKYNDADIDSSPIELALFSDADFDDEQSRPPVEFQQISHWLGLQSRNELKQSAEAGRVVKVLVGSNKILPLLRLARKGVKLDLLGHVTYSNFFHYGTRRILEDALQLYLHVNLAIANGTISASKREFYHQEMASFIRGEILMGSDYDDQLALFFRPYFDLTTGTLKSLDDAGKLAHESFRMVYQYAVVSAECGKPIDFQHEISLCLRYVFKFEKHMGTDDHP